MADTVLLDHYKIPEKGRILVQVNLSFEIRVTAVEAHRMVDAWLHDDVSYLMGAGEPLLVIANGQAFWRVPAIFTSPQAGVVGTVGTVDVDVHSGRMIEADERKSAILQEARRLAAKLPPYTPQRYPSPPSGEQAMNATMTKPHGNPLEITAAHRLVVAD